MWRGSARHRGIGVRGSAASLSEQLPLVPESRAVPHPPARRGGEEDSGFALQAGCFSRRVRVSGVLCKGKSERLSARAVVKFAEVFRRWIFRTLRE